MINLDIDPSAVPPDKEYKRSPDLNPNVPARTYILENDDPHVIVTKDLDKFYGLHQDRVWDFKRDIKWGEVDSSDLTEKQIQVLRGAMLVESHNPVYISKLLEFYTQDQEMTAFLPIWGYEEMKHYYSLRHVLKISGRIDIKAFDHELQVTRQGEWGTEQSKLTVAQNHTYAMIQELITGTFYNSFARGVENPELKRLLRLISKDEHAHQVWYLRKGQEELKRNPRALDEIKQLLLDFQMPGFGFIQDFAKDYEPLFIDVAPELKNQETIKKQVSILLGPINSIRVATDRPYIAKLKAAHTGI